VSRIGLLPRILIAIVLGILLGSFIPLGIARFFATVSHLFSQFISFCVPILIFGLVVPAITRMGHGAGRFLLLTIVLAYGDTVLSALLGYGIGSWLFPDIVAATGPYEAQASAAIEPYFKLLIPPFADVLSVLLFSFILGMAVSRLKLERLTALFEEFQLVISFAIKHIIVPLLPFYILSIFTTMTFSGEVYRVIGIFLMIIVVIFVIHIFILLYEFCVAGLVTRRNPLRLLRTMLPAYFMALGTSSSAATIPVTLDCTLRNGVRPEVAGFTVPLCATIHMSGSAMKITCFALAVCLMQGLPHDSLLFLSFILMLGIMMVASPGVPGGSIMAALAPLSSILGFGAEAQALMITLYIAIDSFGTACNVTGDGAIALIIDKVRGQRL